jgi:cold shock CspA family protein
MNNPGTTILYPKNRGSNINIMAKSKDNNFNKQEAEKRKKKKQQEKEQRKEERKAAKGSKSFEEMLAYVDAYVDENGNITSTPPDPTKKKVIREEDIEVSVKKQDPNQAPEAARRGRVTFFNSSKGYGFIKDQNTQESIFVHINAVDGDIKENDKVTFQVQMGPKGLNAVDVKVVN